MQTLRFITCGSVDDGKSTLIGRLLYESKNVFDDQFASLAKESKQFGTQGESLDFALLVDGLQAEREQGITIDVAYRFFATEKRRFIVADTPGHEQYTRNMATGASTAQLAIVLVDARKGILPQTLRHSRIVSLMGIQQIILAVNKMDLIQFNQACFADIVSVYQTAVSELGFASITAIPVCAVTGENLFTPQTNMPWYLGSTLMTCLEQAPIAECNLDAEFKMPVQWVNRPNLDFRGFCGRIAQGRIKVGDAIKVAPSGKQSQVKAIWQGFETVNAASEGMSIILTLKDEVDISRGDVLVSAYAKQQTVQNFEANLIWMSETPLTIGQAFILKIHSKEVLVTITKILYQHNINTNQTHLVSSLAMNDIASVEISCHQPLVVDTYAHNKILGAFILIHKHTFETVAGGMIQKTLQHNNVHWHDLEVTQKARAELKQQSPKCIWLTGLSGAGKSTLGNLLEKQLHALGKHTYLLDGDNLRHGLTADLGFTDADRAENIRRVAQVAKLMVDAGLVVIVCLISPFKADRNLARGLFTAEEFMEVFVDTDLATCEERDPKGLYAKARAGNLPRFTGIGSPYEVPEDPEVHLLNSQPLEQWVAKVLDYVNQH